MQRRQLITMTLTVLLSVVCLPVQANHKQLYDEKEMSARSVLPPGAKLVAGDLAKNEFFILAPADQARPIAPADATPTPMPIVAPTKAILASNITSSVQHGIAKKFDAKSIVPAVRVALTKVMMKPKISHHQLAKMKTHTKVKVASQHKPVINKVKLAVKNPMHKRVAIKQITAHKHKTVAMKKIVPHKHKTVAVKKIAPHKHKTVAIKKITPHKHKVVAMKKTTLHKHKKIVALAN